MKDQALCAAIAVMEQVKGNEHLWATLPEAITKCTEALKQEAVQEPVAEKYDRVVDRAWTQFCAAIGDSPKAPYPGMITAFENYYAQSFADRGWRNEASVWAAAWKAATNATPQQAAPGYQLVPIGLLKRVEQSLGSFCSDEGWAQEDMDVMNSVSALLAAPKGIK